MLRLQLQDKATERQFAWQMERDRRQWQLDLKKLDQSNKVAMAEVGAKKERDAMLWQFPEIIGSTIAKGLMSSRATGAPIAGQAAPPRRQSTRPIAGAENMETDAQASMSGRKISAAPGEAGQIACPECGQSIAIGPTANRAVCAGCGYETEVVRTGADNGQ
jgi:hypothetical protein